MNVQELIDELQKIENKELPVILNTWDSVSAFSKDELTSVDEVVVLLDV